MFLEFPDFLVAHGAYLEKVRAHVESELLHHPGEHVEALPGVFPKRVLLGVSPEPDPFPKVVHVEKMVLPQVVDRLKHDVALDLPEGFGAHLLFLFAVGVGHAVHDVVFHRLRVRRLGIRHPRLGSENSPGRLAETGEIYLRRVLAPREIISDETVHHLPRKRKERFPEVLAAFENFPPLPVHHVSLGVENVVVPEKMLSYVEISPLDLFLGVFYGLAYHRVLDRLAFLPSELVHDARYPLRGEDAHEVVLEGNVESRRAAVPLPSRPSPELVVYPSRLVPLDGENVKTPELPYLFPFGVADRLRLESRLFALLRSGLVGVRPEPFPRDVPGEKFGIPPQQYVRSPARHVGRYGYGPRPAGLGDYFRLPAVTLGVEHVVAETHGVEIAA